MSSSVTLSAATRQNLLSLQNTADLVATTQNRLSTGKKVNSALDNPVNFFTSQSLNSRSADLTTLLDGISNGVQVIQAANQGITNLQKLTDQLKSTSQQALASSNAFTSKANATTTSSITGTATNANILAGTYSNASAAGTAVQNKLTTPVAITGATLLSGGANTDSLATSIAAGDKLTVNGTEIEFVASGATGNQVNITDSVSTLLAKVDSITGAATASSVSAGAISVSTGTTSDLTLGGTALSKLNLTAGTTARPVTGNLTGALTVTVGTGAAAKTSNVTFGTGAGQVSTLDGLNAVLNQNGAQASITSAGKLNITTSNEAGTKAIAFGGAAAASFGTPSTAVLGGDGQTARNKLVTDFNNLLTQIDQQAKDASFNGVNLLNGDNLKITFNEKSTSSLTVQGNAISSAGLGLNSLSSTDFQDGDAIGAVMSKISSAVSQLKTQAATYGSNLSVVQNRQDFTKNLVNILDTGSANLTNADLNEEAANSQALSTRQSLGISALSLANQAQQGILQLLR
ncbi:flagellin N-terminal helical domain-containing protein [Methylorubrum extorquens]